VSRGPRGSVATPSKCRTHENHGPKRINDYLCKNFRVSVLTFSCFAIAFLSRSRDFWNPAADISGSAAPCFGTCRTIGRKSPNPSLWLHSQPLNDPLRCYTASIGMRTILDRELRLAGTWNLSRNSQQRGMFLLADARRSVQAKSAQHGRALQHDLLL